MIDITTEATSPLEAWRNAGTYRVAEVLSLMGGGWRVSLYCNGCTPIEAFGDRCRSLTTPFPGEVLCGNEDGTPISLGATVAAALGRWTELNGEDHHE